MSEYGDEKLDIIVPEANLTVAATSYLTGYAGLNLSVWTGSRSANKYKTQLGAQAGLGIRFNKDISLNAGYTMMNQKYSDTDNGVDVDLDLRASGLNSTLLYTF